MGDSTIGYPEPPGYEADIVVNPDTVGDPLRPSQFAAPLGASSPSSATGGQVDMRARKHDLRMSKRLTLTQGTAFGEDLGFNARSLIVDNNTGQWLYDAASRRYIPPGCFGAVLQFPSGSQIGALTWTAPPGVTQPAGVVGSQAVVIYTEDFLDPSAGVISGSGTGQPTGVVAVTGTGTGGALTTSPQPATALGPITVNAVAAAAAQAQASLPGVAGRTTYIEGFDVTIGAGTTAASISAVAVAGLTTANGSSGTLTYEVQQETTAGATLSIRFPTPIPASAANTAITVTVPATVNGGVPAVTAFGYQL